MKKLLFLLACLWLSLNLQAQTLTVSGDGLTATISGAFPGSIYSNYIGITDEQKLSITSLTITSGSIDATDFRMIKDNMTSLTSINITNITIAEYTGYEGPYWGAQGAEYRTYPANTIPDMGFYYSIKLTSISLPTSITAIGYYGFAACEALTNIVIPNSVTSIGSGAFINCYNLTNVAIPHSVTSLGASAFLFCANLNSITLPASLSSIGAGSFYGCTSLIKIYCYNPTPVTFPTDNTVFTSIDTSCKIYAPNASVAAYQAAAGWNTYTILSLLSVSSSTASLANSAGSNSSVTITTDGSWTASSNQGWLTLGATSGTGNGTLGFTATANPNGASRSSTITVSKVGGEATANQTITVTQAGSLTISGDGKIASFSGATPGCLTGISILSAAQKLSITSLTISSGSIDASDINVMKVNMPALTTLNMPNVTIAAYTGTAGTNGATSQTYPANTMPKSAFTNCTRFTALTLPTSIVTIDDGAFYNCAGVSSISIPSSVTTIGQNAFRYCSSLASTIIPSIVTSLGAYAFSDCTGLSNLTISSGLTSIPTYCFQGCTALNTLTIPSSITAIDSYAFANCQGLTGITIPASVAIINMGAFQNCTSLITVRIPNSVTTVGQSAFQSCTSLTSVTIPPSVTTIGASAFYDCSSLQNVYAYRLTPQTNSYPFNKDPGTIDIYVPNSSIASYQATDCWKNYNIVSLLYLSTNTATLASAGGSSNAWIYINASWTASSSQPWLTLSATMGVGVNTNLGFTATANASGVSRTAIITVSRAGGESTGDQTITVTQNASSTFTLSISTPTNGTILVKNGATTINNGDLVATGTVLTITTTPNTNYELNTLTANGTNIIGNSVTITGNTTIVATFQSTIYTWTGSVSADWNTASNWDLNAVPNATKTVIIPNTVNKPIVSGNTSCNTLTINSGAILTIPTGTSLSVTNTITNNAGAAGLIIQASATTANGTLEFHNAPEAPVMATVEMYSKASWNLVAAPGSKFNWQFFGVPVRSIVASPTLTGSVIRESQETEVSNGTRWTQLNSASTLSSFTGYEIVQASPIKYTFTGQLENGNLSKGLTYTAGTTYPGQHIIANPYTAAINIKQLIFGAQTEASVYLYNSGSLNSWSASAGNTAGTSPGQYTAATKLTAGEAEIPGQIPSMQAFLVKAAGVSVAATLDIPYSSVIAINVDKQRAPQADTKVYSIIDVKGSRFADRMWLFTDPNCTRTFDNGWDGRKMLGSSLTPQLCALESDGEYQIDAVADVNNTELGFMAGEDTDYTLTFTHNNVAGTYGALYLVDLLGNKTVDITASGSEYAFTAEQSTAIDRRFKIITVPANNTEAANPNSEKVRIFCFSKTIVIHNNSSERGSLMIYDVAGRFLQSIPYSANNITSTQTTLKPGTYIVKAIVKNETVAVSNVLIK